MSTPLLTAGGRLNDRAWGAAMTQATTAAPVRATLPALRACATRYGWPSSPVRAAADRHPLVQRLRRLGVRAPGRGGLAGAGAATMSRLERHWTGVFVRCGRPTLAAQDRWLAAQQVRFVRQHQQQVRSVEALARRILRRAGAPAG